jgi:hypothetical protein
MKKFILHGFLLLLLVAVCSRCKHLPPTPPCECGEVNTIDELRQWAYFKTGTYWIYEEQTTLERDTFTVLNSHDFVTPDGYPQFDYETYRSLDDYRYTFWFNESGTALNCNNNCCDCRRIWCSKQTAGDADGADPLFTFPTYVGSYSYILGGGGEGGKVDVVDNFSELRIGSNIFNNVVVELNTNSVLDQNPSFFSYEYYQVKYYFAKGFGIIRKEIAETSEVWNLIDYEIIQ